MLSVIIPTHNDEMDLARMLAPLVSAAVSGVISNVLIYDRGSTDQTLEVADLAGCTICRQEEMTLSGAIDKARGQWLLFLPPGAMLDDDWRDKLVAAVDPQKGVSGPAVLTLASREQKSWWQRIFGNPKGTGTIASSGFLILRNQAKANVAGKNTVDDLARGMSVRRLPIRLFLPQPA